MDQASGRENLPEEVMARANANYIGKPRIHYTERLRAQQKAARYYQTRFFAPYINYDDSVLDFGRHWCTTQHLTGKDTGRRGYLVVIAGPGRGQGPRGVQLFGQHG